MTKKKPRTKERQVPENSIKHDNRMKNGRKGKIMRNVGGGKSS